MNRVNDWSFDRTKHAHAQLHHLMHLLQDWLKPEEMTPPKIVESVAQDHYLPGLPKYLQGWVAQLEPQCLDEMAATVEQYSCVKSLHERPSATREIEH